MKGAIAEPPVNTRIPINNNIRIIGSSHHFFLSFKKNHKSFRNSIIFQPQYSNVVQSLFYMPVLQKKQEYKKRILTRRKHFEGINFREPHFSLRHSPHASLFPPASRVVHSL